MTSEPVPSKAVENEEVQPAASTSFPGEAAAPAPPKHRSRRKRLVILVAGFLMLYLAVSYLLLPAVWKMYGHRHPSLEDIPGITYTADGIPGDPINAALIGTKTEVIQIMLAAKWYPADGLTLRSCLEIAEA